MFFQRLSFRFWRRLCLALWGLCSQGGLAATSVTSTPVLSQYSLYPGAMSGDGRYLVFSTTATDLISGDTNKKRDVFLQDNLSRTLTRVTLCNGKELPGDADQPVISRDGQVIAFVYTDSGSAASSASSSTTNTPIDPCTSGLLVTGDTNSKSDVFLLDRQTQKFTRASVSSAGVQANGASQNPRLSADGRFVAFSSDATNLVAGDTNGKTDIFVYDQVTQVTSRINLDQDGKPANDSAANPVISADGRYVAFSSAATNLVTGVTNHVENIYVADRLTGGIERVNVTPSGVEPDAACRYPDMSADGRILAFLSNTKKFLPQGSGSGVQQIYVKDRISGQVGLASLSSTQEEANADNSPPVLSADGLYLAFRSKATNLVTKDRNLMPDVFIRSLASQTTLRLSQTPAGIEGNNESGPPILSGDSQTVAFFTQATNLRELIPVGAVMPVVSLGTQRPQARIGLMADPLAKTLRLRLDLIRNGRSGGADWWLARMSPDGWFESYNLALGRFVEGFSPVIQTPLQGDLLGFEITLAYPQTAGWYTFWFGLDLDANGLLDNDSLYYSVQALSIVQGTRCTYGPGTHLECPGTADPNDPNRWEIFH